MQAKLSRSLVAFAGLTLMTFAASAQTSIISGTITGEDGKPVDKALVKIERVDIKGAYKVNSKKKGDYLYAGLPLGTYNVSVEIDGKERDRRTGVRTAMSEPSVVDFDLRRTAAPAAGVPAGLTKEQARDMTAEQKAAMEKAMKEQAASMAKNKALNEAFNAGMQAAAAQQYDAAITSFVKASELDPKQSAVWANLADVYVKLSKTKTGDERTGLLNKSYEAYVKVLEIKPDDASAHNNYALALADGKKFAEAEAEITKAATADPAKGGTYYYNLGALLTNNQQLDAAGEAFKKAIGADPNYADAYYQYGIFLISKAKTTADGKVTPEPGTREAFQKYLDLKADGPYAESARGMIAMMATQIETEYKNPAAKKANTKKK